MRGADRKSNSNGHESYPWRPSDQHLGPRWQAIFSLQLIIVCVLLVYKLARSDLSGYNADRISFKTEHSSHFAPAWLQPVSLPRCGAPSFESYGLDAARYRGLFRHQTIERVGVQFWAQITATESLSDCFGTTTLSAPGLSVDPSQPLRVRLSARAPVFQWWGVFPSAAGTYPLVLRVENDSSEGHVVTGTLDVRNVFGATSVREGQYQALLYVALALLAVLVPTLGYGTRAWWLPRVVPGRRRKRAEEEATSAPGEQRDDDRATGSAPPPDKA